MSGNIAPWWKRGWKTWWDNQQTTLLLEDPDGRLEYDAAQHTVCWRGRIAAVHRRWSITIRWGPGTPFLPPAIYPDGLYARGHQLRDGSMCLAPPSFTDVLEIADWLAQARTWLDKYVRSDLAISLEEWHSVSLRRPDRGYRLNQQPHSYLLSPSDWIPPTFYGELVATLPRRTGGLGILRRWRACGQHCWEKFDQELLFPQIGGEEVQGVWALDLPSSDRFQAILAALAKRKERCFLAVPDRPAGAPLRWNLRVFDPAMTEEAARELRQVSRGDPQAPSFGTFLSDFRAQTFIQGLPMHEDELAARTRLSRSGTDDSAIRRSCVVLVGMGALGSEVAHLLAKEQVGRFLLVDGDLLLPGNVARHRLDLSAVGGNKAEQMRAYILRHHRSATVETAPAMLDEALPELSIPDDALLIGMTADLPSERALSAIAQQGSRPCLHAWMECDGRVLRLLRSVPGRDPSLHELTDLPQIPWVRSAPPPAACADNILPGAESNLHAAANFVARIAVDVLCKRLAFENHTLFAPDGLDGPSVGIPAALRGRYGLVHCRVDKKFA
ncbi:MAG: ThiF family adenylyltransferase [Polyangia bacterium]